MVKFAILMYMVSFICALYVFWPQIVKHEQFHKIISQVLSPEMQTKIMSLRKSPNFDQLKQIDLLDSQQNQTVQQPGQSPAPPPTAVDILKAEEEKRLLEQFKEIDKIE